MEGPRKGDSVRRHRVLSAGIVTLALALMLALSGCPVRLLRTPEPEPWDRPPDDHPIPTRSHSHTQIRNLSRPPAGWHG